MRLTFAALVVTMLATGAHAWDWPWVSADEKANRLFVEASPLWAQYQALPERDPAQYEARLQLLTQVNEKLKAIATDYPESSLAVELVSTGSVKNLNEADIDALVVMVEQSIPASALMAETQPLWKQYEALPKQDRTQYEARLKLLTQVSVNLDKLMKDYPQSYEATGLDIDVVSVKREISRLQQSGVVAEL